MRPSRRPVRLLAAGLLATALLTAAACGGDGEGASTESSAPAGDGSTSEASDTTAAGSTDAPSTVYAKPEVEIPAELPTELVVTDLVTGSGPAAASGDIVLVHYVGVRSQDGTEFDNSYDRGEPFPVTLGSGGVIEGWEQGLVGVQQGGRRQLDIPAELAYGDSPQGDVIQAGDALTFVIDVVAVVATPDPSAAPAATIEPRTTTVDEVTTSDLVEGDGEAAGDGDRAFFQYAGYRADTGEQLESTWEAGAPFDLVLDASDVSGLGAELIGMRPGGRREIVVPAEMAFGPEGDATSGVPAGVDLILLVDLIAVVAG